MTTIKTIALIMMVQFISGNLIANNATAEEYIKLRPGDGNDKYNAKTKNGESLKGYFYRVYGDKPVSSKKITLQGPFIRPKVWDFLNFCQANNGYVAESFTKVSKKNAIKVTSDKKDYEHTKIIIHHITLQTKVNCLVHNKKVRSQTWAAVYLDNDKDSKHGMNIFVDYDNCDADDRAYLAIGEYSIHYDQNPKCVADLSTISRD